MRAGSMGGRPTPVRVEVRMDTATDVSMDGAPVAGVDVSPPRADGKQGASLRRGVGRARCADADTGVCPFSPRVTPGRVGDPALFFPLQDPSSHLASTRYWAEAPV